MDWQQNDSVTLANTGHLLPGWGGRRRGDGLQPTCSDEGGREEIEKERERIEVEEVFILH